MERALDLDLLRGALGNRTGLPSPEELQELLANAEVQLFLRQSELPVDLIRAAWYLHSVASVDRARERYTIARQRQAFAVSAHIFDLALQESRWTRTERLTFGFAAAIGYRRGGQDPNAAAIFNKLRSEITIEPPVLDHIETLALEAGLAFLGFETKTLFKWFGSWLRQLLGLADLIQLADLSTTAYGTTHAVVRGTENLLHYLANGSINRRRRAEEQLTAAALGKSGPGEPDARWVAAHLLYLSGEAIQGSVWNPDLLPPDTSDAVRRAFTMASPPILTLWEPQRQLLTRSPSPFAPEVRRLVLSVPTSGGKTLVAQLLSIAHLASTSTSVCYVVPTRTLGREVRRAMASRLRILEKEVGTELPDYPAMTSITPFDIEEFWFDPPPPSERAPDVEIITPERLANLLRHDADSILNRFGMFIFDEAQLIKEQGRGFTLESIISYLNFRTRISDHRIVLISAAMGNAAQVAHWLNPTDSANLFESQWRGPRRLHAIFGTSPRWSGAVSEKQQRRQTYPYRLMVPVHGSVRLRLSDGRPVVGLETTNSIGTLALKAPTDTTDGTRLKRDADKSTKNYVMAAAMIALIGHAGSVLVVAPTRQTAQRLATALAAEFEEDPATIPLVEFVRGQLGDDHPLIDVLRRGVGFHHAGLPIEVLEAIEEAVRTDSLRFLSCTSTLTDGVNLPVRTVVIYDESYQGMQDDLRLQGTRLVNAMGRAGRAGKETEGWIILIRPSTGAVTFDGLHPSQDQLTIASTLTTDSALEAFSLLDEARQRDEDAIFKESTGIAASFIGFIWFVLAASEAAGTPPEDADLHQLIGSMLAAHQLSPHMHARIEATAEEVRLNYRRTGSVQRRSWARTGTSIGTARRLYAMADTAAEAILSETPLGLESPQTAIHLLAEIGVVDNLLTLPENEASWRFRSSLNGELVAVATDQLLIDWISGSTLVNMADTHLSAVPSPAWRIEQLVDQVSRHFEHFLSWTLGAFVEMVNAKLTDAGTEAQLCPELGSYVRYGVSDSRALILMTSGVRSRGLAHRIANQAPSEISPDLAKLRQWLNDMSLAEWRDRFNATSPEILDLLDITRDRTRSLLRTLLETGSVLVAVRWEPAQVPSPFEKLALQPVEDEPRPASTGIYGSGRLVGRVAPQEQSDVNSILDTGLEFEVNLDSTSGSPGIVLTLQMDSAT